MSAPGNDLLGWADSIIANVDSGDWTSQSQEWQDAARQWRDAYNVFVRSQIDDSRSHH